MGSRAEGTSAEQAGVWQALLPLISGVAQTKRDLLQWVHSVGLEVLHAMLRSEAEAIVGTKGRHRDARTHHHWGTTTTELGLGGRRVQVRRPRVRRRAGGEERLPLVEQFRAADALPERVLQQILLGVSTRGYGSSLEPLRDVAKIRGTSKSAAARHLQRRMRSKMDDQLSRSLGELRLLALMLDGISIAGETIVVALGITDDGTKIPLGLWQGSTENATVCAALLQDLLERGLVVDSRLLCVIDGGKGLRKALRDVFAEQAVIQRCQLHKLRNVIDHLPKKLHENVSRLLRAAYRSDTAALARKRLKSLQGWLQREGHDGAAASLAEGLEETLTVLALQLPETLRRCLATTNAIENTMGTVRRVAKNVKRWRNGEMAKRWTAMGLLEAQRRFRRIRGHRDLPKLRQALADLKLRVDQKLEAA